MTKKLNDRIALLEQRQRIDASKIQHLIVSGMVMYVFKDSSAKWANVLKVLVVLFCLIDCIQDILLSLEVEEFERDLDC